MAKLLGTTARAQGPVEFTVPGIHTESQDLTVGTSLINSGVGCNWWRLVIFQRGFTGGTGSVGVNYSLEVTADSSALGPITVGNVILPRKAFCVGIIEGVNPLGGTSMSFWRIVLNTLQGDTLSYDFMLDMTP